MITLAIPNEEITYIYENTIRDWFTQRLMTMNLSKLYQAVCTGDADGFGNEVTAQLVETISVFDYAENYYHGFLAGLLKGCPGYVILSNRENGRWM